MKKVWKVLIVIFCVLVIGGLLVFSIYLKNEKKEGTAKKSDTGMDNIKEEGMTIVATMEDEISDNAMWCGTFQLIWNDLKNDLAKQDVVFTPQPKVVENLNKGNFTIADLSEASYYKTYGKPTVALKEEIEKAIKEKFDEDSDILDSFDWSGKNEWFLYVMLKKEFKFPVAFEKLGETNFRDASNVPYFGIETDETGEQRRQVKVWYYEDEDNFAIELETEQKEKVILCKNPEGRSFEEIYKNMQEKQKKSSTAKNMQSGEVLKIPELKVDEKKEFTEVENKEFSFSDGERYLIETALQTIKFELDNEGGKIKSEAGMSIMKSSMPMEPQNLRKFIFDDTFAIFLQEEGKTKPYFAGKITDIKQFQKE